MMAVVCPKTGRSPWRRKKNCLLGLVAAAFVLTLVHMNQFSDRYTSLQPLEDAESEAKRLLKYITHLQYQCNSTYQMGNRTHWPICIEHDTGIDLESKDPKIIYSVGPEDYTEERLLALNYSFQAYIFSHNDIPKSVVDTNNTKVLQTTIVPNDPADFGRNSYGQHTMNDIVKMFEHDHITLLKLHHTASDVQMWELLHYMIVDNIFLKFDQVHMALYVDKIEDDYLYNWYRALFDLFRKEGFRLYHTTSSDSLCLQVTMMQSCMYYLSWIRNPGPKIFVMQPPADFGTQELEEDRLLDYLLFPQTECTYQRFLGQSFSQNIHFSSSHPLDLPVCAHSKQEIFHRPCTVFRFREGNDPRKENAFLTKGCTVHTIQPVVHTRQSTEVLNAPRLESFMWSKASQTSRYTKPKRRKLLAEDVFHLMSQQTKVDLLELDTPGYEWEILGMMLNSGVISNVTQIVADLQIPDAVHGKHPTLLRTRYSELCRLANVGLHIYYVSASVNQRFGRTRKHLDESCCFRVGLLKNSLLS